MTQSIELLRQEHRNIEKLLQILESEFSVFDRGERPDYEILLTVIEYFKDYPDSCHHPKEDLIFAKLKARDPLMENAINTLEIQHRTEARRLDRVAQAIAAVLNDQDFLRHHVDDIVRDFIDHERSHIALEERVVFPAALRALQPVDWAEIALRFADRYDPLSRPIPEGKYEILCRSILRMEEEAEAERARRNTVAVDRMSRIPRDRVG